MTKIYDISIIGAGIIGLATAYELSLRYPDKKIIIVEKEKKIAMHQTGRNSGVIHSGIYYRPGSLKAKTCQEGIDKIYSFCTEHNIAHKKIGKLIIATNSQEEIFLENLYNRGIENKTPGIELIDKNLKDIEPHVEAQKGIWVPITGIVNYVAVCQKLLEISTERQTSILFNKKISRIFQENNLVHIVTDNNECYQSKFMFNCSGLHADELTQLSGSKLPLSLIPFRGEYYKLIPEKQDLVRGLIYPVPNPLFPFLGVHFTKMIDGSVEIGPNAVISLKREGYKKTSCSIKDSYKILKYKGFWKFAFKHWKTGISEYHRSLSKKAFVASSKKLLPIVTAKDMEFQRIGVRAQALDRNGNLVDDFCIQQQDKIIHILNAPSPAATASLAIAKNIVDIFAKQH